MLTVRRTGLSNCGCGCGSGRVMWVGKPGFGIADCTGLLVVVGVDSGMVTVKVSVGVGVLEGDAAGVVFLDSVEDKGLVSEVLSVRLSAWLVRYLLLALDK